MLTVAHMEMRRWVLTVVHRDDEAEEAADCRHSISDQLTLSMAVRKRANLAQGVDRPQQCGMRGR